MAIRFVNTNSSSRDFERQFGLAGISGNYTMPPGYSNSVDFEKKFHSEMAHYDANHQDTLDAFSASRGRTISVEEINADDGLVAEYDQFAQQRRNPILRQYYDKLVAANPGLQQAVPVDLTRNIAIEDFIHGVIYQFNQNDIAYYRQRIDLQLTGIGAFKSAGKDGTDERTRLKMNNAVEACLGTDMLWIPSIPTLQAIWKQIKDRPEVQAKLTAEPEWALAFEPKSRIHFAGRTLPAPPAQEDAAKASGEAKVIRIGHKPVIRITRTPPPSDDGTGGPGAGGR